MFCLTKKRLSITILPMKKRTKKNGKFSLTEVGVLIEAIRAEFRPYLEIIPGMQEKLNATFEQVGKNTEDIQLIKHILSNHSGEIKSISGEIKPISGEIKSIKGTLNEHTEILNRILEELKSKIDRKDFELLEKKVASLSR